MTAKTRTFVPALRFDRLTPLYDPLLAALLRERAWREALVAQVNPGPGERILDVGCGTGTLTMLLQRAATKAEIVGLDPDHNALSRAYALLRALFLPVQLLDGFATTTDNVRGRLPTFMREAGFRDV